MGEKKATKAVMQETLLIYKQVIEDHFQQFERLKQINFGEKS